MQTNLCIIFGTTATKHVFRHPPIGPFYKYGNPIDINVESVILLIISIFLYTESNIFRFGNFIIHLYFEGTSIQIRFSVSIRPPQPGTVEHQLRIITFVKADGRSRIGR